MNSRSNALKLASKVLLLLILMEIIACYLTWLVFGIEAVIYPAAAYVLTMIVAVPVATSQQKGR